MTVADVKTLAPLADVYELDPAKKYLFVLPASQDARQFSRSLYGLVSKGSSVVVLRDPSALIVRTSEES